MWSYWRQNIFNNWDTISTLKLGKYMSQATWQRRDNPCRTYPLWIYNFSLRKCSGTATCHARDIFLHKKWPNMRLETVESPLSASEPGVSLCTGDGAGRCMLRRSPGEGPRSCDFCLLGRFSETLKHFNKNEMT